MTMVHQSGCDVLVIYRVTHLARTTERWGISRGLDSISVWLGSCLLSWSDSYGCEVAEQDSGGKAMGDREMCSLWLSLIKSQEESGCRIWTKRSYVTAS
jgi:hypothetical protein